MHTLWSFKLLDFNEKVQVLRNLPKLNDTCYTIKEDFSDRVRTIRKKLWDATTSFRNLLWAYTMTMRLLTMYVITGMNMPTSF